jgi:hypothetical protein
MATEVRAVFESSQGVRLSLLLFFLARPGGGQALLIVVIFFGTDFTDFTVFLTGTSEFIIFLSVTGGKRINPSGRFV